MSSERVSLCLIQDKEKLREQKVFKRALGGGHTVAVTISSNGLFLISVSGVSSYGGLGCPFHIEKQKTGSGCAILED